MNWACLFALPLIAGSCAAGVISVSMVRKCWRWKMYLSMGLNVAMVLINAAATAWWLRHIR